MKKIPLVFTGNAIVLMIVIATLYSIKSGKLVIPTARHMQTLISVPQYDVMEWQANREQDILSDYRSGIYGIDDPYIILDPYEMNPLSALLIFETMEPAEISVTVVGKDEFSSMSYNVVAIDTHHEVPVIGLYPGIENTVILDAAFQNNTQRSTINIRTEPLPSDFQVYELITSVPEKSDKGFTLATSCFADTYSALIDCNADIRAYLSNKDVAHGTSMIVLSNGNILSTGDELKQIPYNKTSLWEYNWLGKVYREYDIENAVHHSMVELPDGNILLSSNSKNIFQSGTREDVVIILDRASGNIVREYDFRKILDENRHPYHHFDPGISNQQNIDWMHTNSAVYSPEDNSLIVSSPTQSQVVSVDADSSQINWILGPHEGYEGSSEYLAQYLLQPIGDLEWQWCQHDVSILPDLDNNVDTIDLLLLDNGQSKSFYESNAVNPEDNYSRAVQFRVDTKAKTVKQIWQYGKERGSECYTTFLGSAKYLPDTGNRLISFGGQLRVDEKPVDDIISGVVGGIVTRSRIVEVTGDNEVVFEVAVKENKNTKSAETYQARRISDFDVHGITLLGTSDGQRLGRSYFTEQAVNFKFPSLFIGKVDATFNKLYIETDRLVADGQLYYDKRTYMLGRAVMILRNDENAFAFPANSGLNGRFFLSIDLELIPKGEYEISIAGAVREGTDALSGRMHSGYFRTGYKLDVR